MVKEGEEYPLYPFSLLLKKWEHVLHCCLHCRDEKECHKYGNNPMAGFYFQAGLEMLLISTTALVKRVAAALGPLSYTSRFGTQNVILNLVSMCKQ